MIDRALYLPQSWTGDEERRRLGDGALTFYPTRAPEGTALTDRVRVAGARCTIESSFEMAKGEVGLDHYEVRSWIGWHHHIILTMLAFAFLTVLRKAAVGGGF